MSQKEQESAGNNHSIQTDSIVVAAKDQVSCDLAGEAAILDLKTGVYYGLDSVGARIWDLMKDPTPVSRIRDQILEEYDVDEKQCQQDMIELLNQLADAGLVEVRPPAA